MQVAILLFDEVVALDAIGPYDVLKLLPGADVRLVASHAGEIATDGPLRLVADAALEDVPRPDLVVIPGGPGALVAGIRRAANIARAPNYGNTVGCASAKKGDRRHKARPAGEGRGRAVRSSLASIDGHPCATGSSVPPQTGLSSFGTKRHIVRLQPLSLPV